jgi:hypothetical protein
MIVSTARLRGSIAAAALVLCLAPSISAAQDDVGEPLRLAPIDPEPAGDPEPANEAEPGGAADDEAVSAGEPDTAASERRSAKEKPSSSRDIEGT